MFKITQFLKALTAKLSTKADTLAKKTARKCADKQINKCAELYEQKQTRMDKVVEDKAQLERLEEDAILEVHARFSAKHEAVDQEFYAFEAKRKDEVEKVSRFLSAA